jgi:hypothetical protein
MTIDKQQVGKRVLNLVFAVRGIGLLLPGEQVKIFGERPALYVGPIEVGDIQIDYLHMHTFSLHDRLLVVLAVPALNRNLGRFIY